MLYNEAMTDQQGKATKVVSLDAVDPENGRVFSVTLPDHRLEWAVKLGKGAVYELRDHVTLALTSPTAIFRGLRYDDDEPRQRDLAPGWLCYCVKPPERYELATGERRYPKSRVLLVFVNEDKVCYHHRWEVEDGETGLPVDHQNRFREKAL